VVDQIVLMADLSAHLEVSYISDGHPVATFNLAFRVSKKKTGSIKVVCLSRHEVTVKTGGSDGTGRMATAYWIGKGFSANN
jgi:hypothetical protein